jgi:arylsulfatase A-like enzyme
MASGERPRWFRAGVLLGVGGGVVVGALELAWILASAFGYFDGARELARFALYAIGLCAGAGLVLGVVEGAIGWTLDRAFGGRVPAWAFTACLAPAAVVVSVLAFRGAWARTLPGHRLLSAGLALVFVAGAHATVRLVRAAAAHADDRRIGWGLVVAGFGGAVAALLVDLKVLPRLYPFFHVGLGVGAFALAQVGLFALHQLRGRVLPARLVPVFAALAVVVAGASVAGFEHARGLRTLALERTATVGRLLRVAQAAHPVRVAPNAPGRAVAQGPLEVLHGPHLGPVDVVLITVDAMRADRLTPEVAPTLARLASSGVTFEHAYTQVPHTSFSVATLLTGKHVYSLSALGLDAASHETMAEIMRRERYKTAAFYPPSVFFIDHDRLKGLEQSSYGFEYVKYEYLPAARRTDQVIDYFEREKPERAFVWVHYLEPHEPYERHPETRTDSTMGRYEGEIRHVDGQVARLVEWISAHRNRALVIIAADHGEEFGEHGGHYHGTTLYEEQVHVPLAFALVGTDTGLIDPARVPEPVGLVDVAPTVLALLGIEPSLRMRGQDLSPLFSKETRARFTAARFAPQFAEIDRKKMIVVAKDKLICDLETESCQLFDVAADPGEQHPRDDAAKTAQLRARLDAWLNAQTRFEAGGVAALDEPTRKVLERGRLGDRTAARELARLVSEGEESVRVEAARLLASLPPDPATRAALEGARHDVGAQHWVEVDLARLGDAAAQKTVAGFIAEACAAPGEVPLCARAALALGDPAWLARALERATAAGDGTIDEPLVLKLAQTLGASHDPHALDALLPALGPVRTRAGVVDAIAALGDVRAIPTLERWLPADPYIPVRAAIARALVTLGPADPTVRTTLEAHAAVERDPLVLRAMIEGLHRLGSPRVTAADKAQALGPGELWLVGDGGITRIETKKAGAVSVPAASPPPRLAFWRRVPEGS